MGETVLEIGEKREEFDSLSTYIIFMLSPQTNTLSLSLSLSLSFSLSLSHTHTHTHTHTQSYQKSSFLPSDGGQHSAKFMRCYYTVVTFMWL